MSASLIPDEFLIPLRKIYREMQHAEIDWVITGSLGLAIKGIPISPQDIDIQTHRAGLQRFASIFSNALVQPPTIWESERIRSITATFVIAGIKVDIMGDVQFRDEDGFWDDTPNLSMNRIFLQVADMRIPTFTLDFEEEIYRAMGRADKAALITQYLRVC